MNIIKSKFIRGILYAVIIIVSLSYLITTGHGGKFNVNEEYRFDIKQDTNISLAVLLPKNGPYQKIDNIKIDWEGDYEIVQYDNLQAIRITGKVKENEIIKISYDANIKKGKITWEEDMKDKYYNSEENIESENETIIKKAKEITEENSLEDVKKIYDFVSQYISWPPKGVDRINASQSALNALETREGVCGDFANLMVALLRANGIPAKSISGLSMQNSLLPTNKKEEWSHQGAAHAWVEFYAEGKWHFADPSWGGDKNFNNVDGLHLSFGDKEEEKNVYEENKEWVIKDYEIIGAWSAPFKFIAGSDDRDVTVIPTGYIRTNYYHFIFMGIPIVLFIIIEIFIKRKNNRR